MPRIGKFRDRKYNTGYQGRSGGENGALLLNGYIVLVRDDEIVVMAVQHDKCI